MSIILHVDDLKPFADIDEVKAQAMIDDVEAVAIPAAPCLAEPGFKYRDAAKAILRRAVLRWNDSGVSGTVVTETDGPFSQTVKSGGSTNLLWPSEIAQLQKLCRSGAGGSAFTITPTINSNAGLHSDVCSTVWGEGCSCGSNINGNGGPLWEI